jgi:hypothetical protein
MPDALLQPHLMAWSALFGTVSFELFGQLHNVAVKESDDCQGFFSECVRHWPDHVGIALEVPGETDTGATTNVYTQTRSWPPACGTGAPWPRCNDGSPTTCKAPERRCLRC